MDMNRARYRDNEPALLFGEAHDMWLSLEPALREDYNAEAKMRAQQ